MWLYGKGKLTETFQPYETETKTNKANAPLIQYRCKGAPGAFDQLHALHNLETSGIVIQTDTNDSDTLVHAKSCVPR